MRVLFVNHGDFGNNSHSHIVGFAQALASRGHSVMVVAGGQLMPIKGVLAVSASKFLRREMTDEERVFLEDEKTIVHAWTPRERVRLLVEDLQRLGLRYVVHLEDDEVLVSATQLGMAPRDLHCASESDASFHIPEHLSHPARYRAFLHGACGVTVIIDQLLAEASPNQPTLVLEPGVDCETFGRRSDPHDRQAAREKIGVGPNTCLLLYHGSVHPAVQRDMFSLYAAIAKLRRTHDAALLRAGAPDMVTKVSSVYSRADGVINLGFLERPDLVATLELADIYVQPGWATPFNARRLPSKLLEFLAMGRPTITPATNMGRVLVDRENAMILKEGGAGPIVAAVKDLIAHPDMAMRIGQNGRELACSRYQFSQNAILLEAFYESLPPPRPADAKALL